MAIRGREEKCVSRAKVTTSVFSIKPWGLPLLGLLYLQSAAAFAQPAGNPQPAPVIAQAPETLSARTQVRLEQLTRELAETIGRVETLEGALAAQKAENARLAGLLDTLKASQTAPQPAVADASLTHVEAASIMGTPASGDAPMFVAPAPPPIAAPIFLTNARMALQSGNYPVAEANLTQLIWLYPVSPEASEGRWLLGEARFVQAAWGTAAQAYVDYLKAAPNGPRASEALVRLAGSFRQLGDNRQRCVALTEFKRRTPRPDPTLKARADAEIALMTCPAA
jgi:TolA-binding protein